VAAVIAGNHVGHGPTYTTISGGTGVPPVVIPAYAGIQTGPRIEVRGDE